MGEESEIAENNKDVKWFVGSEENKTYTTTTWYRSNKIEGFVEKIEIEYNIVGIVFSGNSIGFILDDKK